MLAWQDWTFPVGDVLDEGANARVAPLFADWWGFSLTHLWWTTEGCVDCSNETERC